MKCEICGSENNHSFFPKFSIVKCECGHVFYDQPIDDSAIKKIYEESYFKGEEYLDYLADKKIALRNFKNRYNLLKKYKSSGRLVEIGCAYGFFLSLAKKDFQVKGFEISEDAASYANEELGVDVETKDYLETELERESVDAFVMYDCIEHLKHPSKFMKKISKELKSGGILAITTGDIESKNAKTRGEKWRMIHPPSHIHYFGASSMRNLLERNGFEVVELGHPGYWRSFSLTFARIFKMDSLLTKLPGGYYLNTFDIMEVIARKI